MFVTVITYSITSPGLTIVFSVTGTNSSEPFSFILVATLLISTDGASATGVSISSSSSTFSGSLSGSVGFVSPVTFTSLWTNFPTFSFMSFS